MISSLAGYAIAKGSFRGKYFIFLLILATMMVPFQIIVVPLCKPVLAALAVLNFLWNWNSFLWPLIALEDMNKFTIPIGIAFYQQQFTAYYGTMMAAATVAIIPVLILFVLVQRYVVRGIALTGLKL